MNKTVNDSNVKTSRKVEEKAEVKGEPVDLKAWLAETENVKVKDAEGKETGATETKLVNVNPKVAEALKDATEIKDENGRVIGLQSADLVVEILSANTKIDEKPYTMEYANLRPLTGKGMLLLMDGKMNVEYNGKEGDDKREIPSACKYFSVGYGMLARNAAAARIRTAVEGPDKAIESAIKDLMRAKGWSREKAETKVRAMLADD